MKELSIEEKAKRYDEALEKAHQLCAYPTTKPFISDLQDLFPELKESEDERIRKQIISFLKEFEYDHYRCLDFSSWIAWLEKQGEQKSVDKVESIFEVGNWIVNNQSKYTFLIKRGGSRFQAENTNGDIYSFYLLPNGEEEYHLWTIEDAKDGDVLEASDGSIFIYKCQRNNSVVHYIAVTSCNDLEINKNDYGWKNKNACHPATKEQRDCLFQRIKEEGYVWNEDKKELIKL